MMNRTLKGFGAGIALVVALLSTSINVFVLEYNNMNEIDNYNIILKEKDSTLENNFSINGNVKVKEGLDVILENIK
ncbi:hypothetical protein [Oceanirhabdus seepicola]|uniref:Uncharacterized protein n=1 Tax=Oceanirhabdus seepicola TaxID=2828781 RepID=A0A9J6P038_9CLOT|nr:hypothetical protein [Oceanirhabdus seepicola]MCM1989566.1 hypothetical protein [Oceanirhabdus seepicola]